jgi:hypothetical protein
MRSKKSVIVIGALFGAFVFSTFASRGLHAAGTSTFQILCATTNENGDNASSYDTLTSKIAALPGVTKVSAPSVTHNAQDVMEVCVTVEKQ